MPLTTMDARNPSSDRTIPAMARLFPWLFFVNETAPKMTPTGVKIIGSTTKLAIPNAMDAIAQFLSGAGWVDICCE